MGFRIQVVPAAERRAGALSPPKGCKVEGLGCRVRVKPYTLKLHPEPSIWNPKPFTGTSESYTLNPKPPVYLQKNNSRRVQSGAVSLSKGLEVSSHTMDQLNGFGKSTSP